MRAKNRDCCTSRYEYVCGALHLAERMLKPQIKQWHDNDAGYRSIIDMVLNT